MTHIEVHHPSGATEELVWDHRGLATARDFRAVSYAEFVRTYLSLPGVEVTLR